MLVNGGSTDYLTEFLRSIVCAYRLKCSHIGGKRWPLLKETVIRDAPVIAQIQ